MKRLKKLLRWPLDAEDPHVYGGIVAVSVAAGFLWGWPAGLLVLGASLLFLGLVPHLLRGRVNNVTR